MTPSFAFETMMNMARGNVVQIEDTDAAIAGIQAILGLEDFMVLVEVDMEVEGVIGFSMGFNKFKVVIEDLPGGKMRFTYQVVEDFEDYVAKLRNFDITDFSSSNC